MLIKTSSFLGAMNSIISGLDLNNIYNSLMNVETNERAKKIINSGTGKNNYTYLLSNIENSISRALTNIISVSAGRQRYSIISGLFGCLLYNNIINNKEYYKVNLLGY